MFVTFTIRWRGTFIKSERHIQFKVLNHGDSQPEWIVVAHVGSSKDTSHGVFFFPVHKNYKS